MKMQRVTVKMAVGKLKNRQMYTIKPMVFPTVSTQRVVEGITAATTFTPADAEVLLRTFAQVVEEKLSDGHPVDLGVLGTMRPTIKARACNTAADCNARTITARTIRYSARADLAKAMRNISMHVEELGASAFDYPAENANHQ